MFKKILHFLKEDVWKMDTHKLPKFKGLGIGLLRILLLTFQGFRKNQIQQGASSLTYYTLIAFVPVIAFLVGIARGFLLEKQLQNWLIKEFSDQKEIITKVFEFANASLNRVNQGVLAGAGILILLWAAFKILTNIEEAMNEIWEVKEGRSFIRKFADYAALILFMPLVIFLASGINVYITATLKAIKNADPILQNLGHIIIPTVQFLPFIITVFLWTFLYIFIPNTRVRFKPAFAAAFIVSIIYQIVQWFYYKLQIGVANYNAIYGAFAAIPLFLIWLHLSWLIFLMGAKLGFAIQNVNSYENIAEKKHLNHRSKLIGLLYVARYIIKKFISNEHFPTLTEISKALKIPSSIANYLVYRLVETGVISQVKRKDEREQAFQPAIYVEKLTLKKVIDLAEKKGEEITLPASEELRKILASFERFDKIIEQSDENILIKDL